MPSQMPTSSARLLLVICLGLLLIGEARARGLRQLRGTTPAANTRTPTSTPAKTPSIPTTTKIPTTPATTTNTPTTPATTTNTPTTASASVTAAPSTTATTKTATVATPSITPSTNCISTCYTLMASWVGDGAEPVPPAFPRYSKAKCSEMGTKLASALNIMVRQNPDIEPMAKPFHRTACILGSGDSYMGVQVCGSFKKADHCGALVDQLAADELAAGKLVALARDGSLCAVEDYRFILTTMVANKQPWAFTDNVCAPYYFTADVLCN